MPGATLIRTLLLITGLLVWASSAAAQPAGAASGGSSAPAPGAPSDEWFAVERLNAGLAPAPEALDRSTPMGAMESFLSAAREGRHADAAHLLDLGRIPVEMQAERGPELARKLGTVIESHVWLDWDALPDRPDAVVANPGRNDPMAGQVRRSILVERLDLDRHAVPLRVTRLKPEGGNPVWVFSRQTVGNIDALYERYGPGWLHEILPDDWREQTWLSLEQWELIALPSAVLVSGVLFVLLRLALVGLSRRAPWRAARGACHAACTPAAMLGAAAFLLFASTRLVSFSAPVTTILNPVLITAMVVAVTVGVVRGIDALIDAVTQRVIGDTGHELDQEQRRTYTAIYAARRAVLVVAFLAVLGVILSQLDLFGSLGLSLLASAGVLTVILGIAAQPVLGNIVASLQIAFTQPIRIGDAVQYEGDWAYVEAIFYTFVRLRTWDDRRLVVPVQYFVSKPFENWSVVDKKLTRVYRLTLDPRADVEELRQAYLRIAREDADLVEDETLKVLVLDQDHNGMQVRFYCTAKDADTAWNLHCRLREKTLAWIRENHPGWWPRQRELQFTASERFAEAAE